MPDAAPSGRHVLGRVIYQHTSEPPVLRDGAPQVGVHMVDAGAEPFAEVWLTDKPARSGTLDALVWAEDGEYLFCAFRVEKQAVYRQPVRAAYEAAFELADRLGYTKIFRMWNLVGHITRDNAEGMENYRDFCIGRAEAFERWSSRIGSMPAATGIGALSDGIDCYFLACREGKATFLENPLQTPAYKYPDQYGPKSPSFARATYLTQVEEHATNIVYVSGTASIIGDETVCLEDIDGQLDLTIGNIETLISRGNLWLHGIGDGYRIADLDFIKVYVRDAEHLPVVRAKCAEVFAAHANVVYLNVDVCRPDLLVEIEGICRQEIADR
ncbi:FkbO/Hyg5 family chorismatase [Saccharopolyspora phatthalungensis]|uniref:FkbO/Hyg5 family chorismatase n=1 Tax=Saccharopolyspora phatthalungensis TaxID=664693 RepID=UPI00160A597C|nr:FkbO/Hyg5 family chorismatase [Saccharopolyspora phatthalungensis]